MNKEVSQETQELADDLLYPWATDDNEKRRAFILEYFNYNPEYAAKPQLEAMQEVEKWLSGNKSNRSHNERPQISAVPAVKSS